MPILLKLLQKTEEEVAFPNSFCEATITLIWKTDKDCKKRGGARCKEPTCQFRRCKIRVFNPWSERSPGGEHGSHSSVLAWRILWTKEPGGLQSIGSYRIGHYWRDLAHTHTGHSSLMNTDAKNLQQNSSKLNPTIQSRFIHHDQVVIPGLQELFNVCKWSIVVHHMSKREDRHCMIISIDAEKAFDKIQHPVWQKPSSTWVSVQFSLVTQSCPTLCDPMDCSTPGLPVHHQFPEFTQTHVHWVGDAIQPSHPLSSPSPPAPNPSQH